MPTPSLAVRALTVLAALVLWTGCDSFGGPDATVLSGRVLNQETSTPVVGATVKAIGSGATAVTGSDGAFSLTVPVDSSDQTFRLEITAPNYNPGTSSVRFDGNEAMSIETVFLRQSAPSGGGSGGDSDDPVVSTNPIGPAYSVTIEGRSSESIAVTGAGATETAALRFIAYDADGRRIDAANATELSFEIASGPGGGEAISPQTATTDGTGAVIVTLTSGTKAGAVQVVASGRANGRAFRSSPVTIVITGGLPDDAHFSVGPARFNVPGYSILGVPTTLTAYVGDRYGNPVQPGTSVYFTSASGITSGSGATDDMGRATSTYITADPSPNSPAPNGCSADNRGYTVVTARTADADRQPIETTTTLLISGETQISLDRPAGLEVGASYVYTVDDQFGHPLAAGTRISVQADGVNVRATGDTDVVLGDYLCPGTGRTQFTFSVAIGDTGADEGAEPEEPILQTLTITVRGPNGDAAFTRSGAAGGRTRGGRVVDTFERL